MGRGCGGSCAETEAGGALFKGSEELVGGVAWLVAVVVSVAVVAGVVLVVGVVMVTRQLRAGASARRVETPMRMAAWRERR